MTIAILLLQVLALLSSTVTTFAVSPLLERVIRAVDIQNATLAGGVAIGASANLLGVKPWGAMAIGTTAGLISTWGFCRLQPWLEDRGLHDSCGAYADILKFIASCFILAGVNGIAGRGQVATSMTCLLACHRSEQSPWPPVYPRRTRISDCFRTQP